MNKLTRGSRLIVASHNKGKVWEINQLLAPYGLDAISVGDLDLPVPDETETTFRGNALIKARAAAQQSKLPALADDSGLEIAALDGAPGVYSADWAGPGRDFGLAMQRVNAALEDKNAWQERTPPAANFISVLCLAWPDGTHTFYEGTVHGHVVWPPRGGNGFGYDPMFVPDGATETFGEMEPAGKAAISHRTRAFAAFKRDCLDHIATVPVAGPQVTADDGMAALAAAAANLSTAEELQRFVANLRADLVQNPGRWAQTDLAGFLSAIEAWVEREQKIDEPRWRSVARALLAGRGTGPY